MSKDAKKKGGVYRKLKEHAALDPVSGEGGFLKKNIPLFLRLALVVLVMPVLGLVFMAAVTTPSAASPAAVTFADEGIVAVTPSVGVATAPFVAEATSPATYPGVLLIASILAIVGIAAIVVAFMLWTTPQQYGYLGPSPGQRHRYSGRLLARVGGYFATWRRTSTERRPGGLRLIKPIVSGTS